MKKKALEDTWWQEIDIDSRTNLLPTLNTPPLAVVKQLRLVLPIQQIEEWDGYRNWAAKNKLTNLAAPIKDSCWGEALAKITSPNFNEISSGTIPIQGRATSLDFQEYELLWATKNNPSTWFRINRSNMKVINGLLGVWNTSNLPNGDYIIKLLVNDKKLNFVEFITPISINSLQTQVSIDMPRLDFNIANEGIIVKNEMQVTAIKSTELSYQIFLGEGVAPVDWKNLSAEIIERNNLIEIKWNTKQVADGIYRIKIESIHPQLGSISSSAIIHVDNYPWQ